MCAATLPGAANNQMIRRYPNADVITLQVVGMAGEDRFKLAASRQLQAVQGRSTLKGPARDACFQVTVGRINDIVRAQQDIHGTAADPRVRPVAAQSAEFGAHRLRIDHLPANEIALTDEAGDKGRARLVIQVVRRVPLFQATFLEHANVIADGEGFFLVVGHQNGAGATRLEDISYLMAQPTAQLAVQV